MFSEEVVTYGNSYSLLTERREWERKVARVNKVQVGKDL